MLVEFLDGKARSCARQRMPPEIVATVRRFLEAGGKRLRPLLCVLGWRAGRGHGSHAAVFRIAAGLEMFHVFALVHDDVMDRSATRRGSPTVHEALAASHRSGRTRSGAERFGLNAAILIGDAALVWADELIHTAPLPGATMIQVLAAYDEMRNEVLYGQYLDVQACGQGRADLDGALKIARFKSAKYTVERPLHIGALAAGADRGIIADLSAFAIPIGEAFQLRDDLLGVYGNQAQTGKPVDDDLREGKHTVLTALALQRLEDPDARHLRSLLTAGQLEGDGAQAARRLMDKAGAPRKVEQMIIERRRKALHALAAAANLNGTTPDLQAVATMLTRGM